ncbi:A/G-specific adenine glycosylase [Chthonomonas calidirosea]|uniref:Adenine DNA glycosylase n=1 Tax=Chthonomonas calidirosea (strain DSM 23976 / ICMP 18418 / T49) TaxID=1303518 RepID=S0EZC4_CHTCT|nr:A/G-specific adenine glycosylase [Chthonomonas calidirosea]CCW35672.1 A/G-specific DNA-adenine glycosylase [Chthonomonas calidirosea T49]CEK18565.1 A/G-specific DNA-adenine glycosylase [Chthonomonas calidirosea]CEK19574.1 A/G-specific DNA-adenine glycosylase [Chthonomonas calidirosea]
MKAALNEPVTSDLRERIVTKLLEWYLQNKRDLPWRGASAYGVWVSEIMLQQTQVATVIPYYLRFMERFPTVRALAEASQEEVLRYWAGLGYYARARNLHQAAKILVERYGGELPTEPGAIESLPGVGRYTAGAIRSIAFHQPYPLVDANVARVLSRLFGVSGNLRSTSTQARLWNLAQQLVPENEPGTFNQALMELGSLVCIPSDPRCEQCPLLADCVAGNAPDPTAWPEASSNKRSLPVVHSSALICNEEGALLIVQRPPHGLWGGLWEFPRVVCSAGETPLEGAHRAALEVAGWEVTAMEPKTLRAVQGQVAPITRIKHGVMHYRITLYGYLMRPKAPVAPKEERPKEWVTPEALSRYPMPAPQAQLREAVLNRLHAPLPNIQPCFVFEETNSPDYAKES